MRRFIVAFALFLFSALPLFSQVTQWSGNLSVGQFSIPVIFNIRGYSGTLDSPEQGARDIPIEVEYGENESITIKIPSINASFIGNLKDDMITGYFSQNGAKIPLLLKRGALKLNRPQTPKPPHNYLTEEVSFKNSDALLCGTLSLPKGYNRSTPVLIMITGSGLQNRDEEIFEHKPFYVIADAFANAGIATLRYDDRGFGESTGDVTNCTTVDLKNDALSGIALLRERFDKVGVIGHSEGGTIALMLAHEKKVDFAISLAAMVVSGKETLISQNRDILIKSGYSNEVVDNYCNLLEEAFDTAVKDEPLPSATKYALPESLRHNYDAVAQQLATPYLKAFVSLDTRPLLGTISIPILALNGTKDVQVDHKANLGALLDLLPKNKKNKIESVEGLNHLFQHCLSGEPNEYKNIEETFAPEVIAIMIDWIKKL